MNLSVKSPAFSLVVTLAMLLSACDSGPQPSSPNANMPIPSTAATETTEETQVAPSHCTPTFGDELSPSYKPDAPVRMIVGKGHVLTGTVRSSRDCTPIANARLEMWSEEAGQGHPDEYRATVFTDENGAYRFECSPTDHIHMLISAEGYESIASNAYHTEGRPEGVFDIVLKPLSP